MALLVPPQLSMSASAAATASAGLMLAIHAKKTEAVDIGDLLLSHAEATYGEDAVRSVRGDFTAVSTLRSAAVSTSGAWRCGGRGALSHTQPHLPKPIETHLSAPLLPFAASRAAPRRSPMVDHRDKGDSPSFRSALAQRGRVVHTQRRKLMNHH